MKRNALMLLALFPLFGPVRLSAEPWPSQAVEFSATDDNKSWMRHITLTEATVHYQEQPDGTLTINQFAARVRNDGFRRVRAIDFKIRILDPNGVAIDTQRASFNFIYLEPGDVKRRTDSMSIPAVPKGFKWTYEITGGDTN